MSAFIAALVSGALAYNATETVKTTEFTTYCPEPTVFTYQNSTYTVTEATTLTITDCGCEESHSKTIAPVASAKNTSAPAVANGVAAGKVGAVAGAAAVAALLL